MLKCPLPPELPPKYVCRQELLDEMVSMLCQYAAEPITEGNSMIVNGSSGVGKTLIVTALCHDCRVKKIFTDGFLFVTFGQQCTDPFMKLRGLYILLTDNQCNVNVVEHEISQLTELNCRHLLVIIDDFQHYDDVKPLLKAFRHCKTILTTRIKDITKHIPTKWVVTVGPMNKTEAVTLITHGVIDISHVSPQGLQLLEDLALTVSKQPFLLTLVRGQLSRALKSYPSSYHEAIKHIKTRVTTKGLLQHDVAENCIKLSLELLDRSHLDRMKSLILYTGIGASLQTAVLYVLWNISEHEANDTLFALNALGLVYFTDITIPPYINKQQCVAVHDLVSQYIIKNFDTDEIMLLSPIAQLGTFHSVSESLQQLFDEACDSSLLTAEEYLHYRVSIVENFELFFSLKNVNMEAALHPHSMMMMLEDLRSLFLDCPNILSTLNDQINTLIAECKRLLKDIHTVSRTFSLNVQRCLLQRDYSRLIQTLEDYSKNSSVSSIAQQAVKMIKPFTDTQILGSVFARSDEDLLSHIVNIYECFVMKTSEYDNITLQLLPYVSLISKELKDIFSSLLAGPCYIERTFDYYKSGQWLEEREIIKITRLFRLQPVVPNFVNQKMQHTAMS